MRQDAHGLTITTDSDAAAAAFDHAVMGYLKYRADLPQRVAALLQAAPAFGLAHCLQGYVAMLAYKQAVVPVAEAAAQTARRLTARATPREQAHVDALGRWAGGDIDGAIAVWEHILGDHPHDVLAFRLAHFTNFWLGRPQDMAASVERVMPHWSEALPGYAAVLACRCFAQEECGNYLAAEPSGRRAIEIDPGDLWAAHAVAHVMEMQGRRSEGLQWLTALAPHWEGANNLQHHLWWHCALFHLEHGDTATVLELYDTRFRNLASPLTMAQPDVYIDIQNAASMLFRLERLGIAVGARWDELADKAEARIGDCLSAFTLPHWMMALAAAGRADAADRLVGAMRAGGNAGGTVAPIVRDYALPVSEAVRAHRAGRHAEAVALMRPALSGMYRLGGSHTQQDVLEQLFLDAALRAGLTADVRMILERVTGRRALPPQRWAGWRDAACQVVV
ncbi:tetratricopeptide repeat protein [Limobrevibacterium gyesilva]|uniref:Tetratricopeptide repeat protein 38 n=1 Tax=Limobrevibacterium gyesilva TaxID=2991712 RepID=A0AA41YKF8_9PROT|nr:tetratricopeptide repeat protein [Limobrevibacterium gyesilva]MCW3473827.1 tetratricopeptide repeat protein [Limobrevibacterium gyesilva]